MDNYNYLEAHSRNAGWVTVHEQSELQSKVVAIAGLGGVGGHYCEIMARLGVSHFKIADLDVYEIQNFNRQAGANVETIGISKTKIMAERIALINPHAIIEIFETGIDPSNVDEFLSGADIYLDGMDFFNFEIRELLFDKLKEKGIPAITVAPIGMGASILVFDSRSMSFANYFGLSQAKTLKAKAQRLLLGLTPTLQQRHYLVDKSTVRFAQQQGPSTAMACYLCASMAGTTALKILLKRGEVLKAPWSTHVDLYQMSILKRWAFWGWRNPLITLKRQILKFILD